MRTKGTFCSTLNWPGQAVSHCAVDEVLMGKLIEDNYRAKNRGNPLM